MLRRSRRERAIHREFFAPQTERPRPRLSFIAPVKAASLSRYNVPAGDLLFARSGATTGQSMC
ncbi:MAG TPA: hypothetical protein VK540_12835, partial [Polyangiaceae bacterium]|nr:hypothetical protein [Polyangiaceae bacterium]